MANAKNQTLNRMVMVSIVYFVLALFVFTVVVYAWFSLTNTNKAALVSQVSGVEAEYEFYIYRDSTRNGSQNLTLDDNVCGIGDDQCYAYIANPTFAHLIPGYAAPGERYSLAIKVRSTGETAGKIKFDMGAITSLGYDIPKNKIQVAFEYRVDKISIVLNGLEGQDVKDTSNIEYHVQHFTYNNDYMYPLIANVPFGSDIGEETSTIVYFSFYFDPTIHGEMIDGTPYTNSNIFMNQSLIINKIYMIIS